jgi:SAM-dependent methyltransferase
MQPDTLAAITTDLGDFFSVFGEDTALREALLRVGLSRLVWTIDMVPEELRAGHVLQLGAEPYLLTLCLRRVCSGRLTLVNYFGVDELRGRQVLVNRRTGEQLQLEYDHVNVETDDFPYSDASVDVVMACEIIEHLAMNPVRMLSEIHRVLRPNGLLVITTPNRFSLARLDGFLEGRCELVDRYMPAFGYGARHNREYRPQELRELLEATGFVIDQMFVRDLAAVSPGQRLRHALWKRILAWHSDEPREEHIFLRARRGPRFSWTFPQSLFDHIGLYVLVRHSWLEMGINDSIQCGFGWHSLETGATDHCQSRWIDGAGQALLKAPEHASGLGLECFASAAAGADPLPVRVAVRHRRRWRADPANIYAEAVVQVPRGAWRTLLLDIPRRPPAGEEIEVNIEPNADALGAPALAVLPARERGLAVRKVWFITEAIAR